VAALNDFVRDAIRFYPHLSESDVRMVLVHPGEIILPELDPRLGRYAGQELRARGVDVRTGTRVLAVSEKGVILSDGTSVDARTIVWTAGTTANPVLGPLPCAKDRGRIVVTPELNAPEWPGVWALGDCAAIPNPLTGGQHPPTAQHAIREARVAADNIISAVLGNPGRAFRFPGLGQLAAIGRRAGVAQIFGLRFSGFIAWLLWRAIYLSKLPRIERKVRVALDWTLDVVFSKDLVQIQTGREPALADLDRNDAAVSEPDGAVHIRQGAA
jgi:NADH dehydrogenase